MIEIVKWWKNNQTLKGKIKKKVKQTRNKKQISSHTTEF